MPMLSKEEGAHWHCEWAGESELLPGLPGTHRGDPAKPRRGHPSGERDPEALAPASPEFLLAGPIGCLGNKES